MATPKLPEDRTVLQAKFENANRLIQVYGEGIPHVENTLHTLLILKQDVTWEELLHTQRQSMIPLAKAAVDISLIAEDLSAAQASLGDEFKEVVADCARFVDSTIHYIVEGQQGSADRQTLGQAKADFLLAVILFMKVLLFPAANLRDHLKAMLNRGRRERVETIKQFKRRERDEQILRLAQLHHTQSPAEVLKLARRDKTLLQLCGEGERITIDIVRNVLENRKPRRKPRKSTPPKNTGQAKKPTR